MALSCGRRLGFASRFPGCFWLRHFDGLCSAGPGRLSWYAAAEKVGSIASAAKALTDSKPFTGGLCVRTSLSPRWGWSGSHSYPRLAPWAAFLRRSAASSSTCVPLFRRNSRSHTLKGFRQPSVVERVLLSVSELELQHLRHQNLLRARSTTKINNNVNISLKGGGQECPPYTTRFRLFYPFYGPGM